MEYFVVIGAYIIVDDILKSSNIPTAVQRIHTCQCPYSYDIQH